MKYDLDKLERLEREATQGEWQWIIQEGEDPDVLPKLTALTELSLGYKQICDFGNNSHADICWGSPPTEKDMLFIAVMRNAAPAMIEDLRRMEAALKRIEGGQFIGAAKNAMSGDWQASYDDLQFIAREALGDA